MPTSAPGRSAKVMESELKSLQDKISELETKLSVNPGSGVLSGESSLKPTTASSTIQKCLSHSSSEQSLKNAKLRPKKAGLGRVKISDSVSLKSNDSSALDRGAHNAKKKIKVAINLNNLSSKVECEGDIKTGLAESSGLIKSRSPASGVSTFKNKLILKKNQQRAQTP
jgi:hypothetical protein